LITQSVCGGDGRWWFHRNTLLQPALKAGDVVKFVLAALSVKV
jgi:hypothetical protein